MDWTLTLKKFATGTCGISSFLALLLFAAWFAIATGGNERHADRAWRGLLRHLGELDGLPDHRALVLQPLILNP